MSGVKRDCQCPRARHVHGTNNAYVNDQCRCDDCTAAAAETYRNRYKLRAYGRWQPFVGATGTARRLQALATLGWDAYTIGERIGVKGQYVHELRSGKPSKVTPATAAKIQAAYDELWDQRRQTGQWRRTMNYAIKHGWLPPLAWDDIDNDPEPATVTDIPVLDDIAIERAMRGEQVHLTRAERAEAARRLHAAGWGESAISKHLHMSWRRVTEVLERAA